MLVGAVKMPQVVDGLLLLMRRVVRRTPASSLQISMNSDQRSQPPVPKCCKPYTQVRSESLAAYAKLNYSEIPV